MKLGAAGVGHLLFLIVLDPSIPYYGGVGKRRSFRDKWFCVQVGHK